MAPIGRNKSVMPEEKQAPLSERQEFDQFLEAEKAAGVVVVDPPVEGVEQDAGDHTPAPDASKAQGKEQSKAPEGAKTEVDQKSSKSAAPAPDPVAEKAAKEAARKEKTWKEINEEKERIRQERAEIERLREESKRNAPQANKEADDYDRIASEFDTEGKPEMAKLAREKANAARQSAQKQAAEASQGEFLRKWNECYADQCDKHPDLADNESTLYKAVAAIMKKETILTQIPSGIQKAVEIVQHQINSARATDLQTKLDAANAKIEELNKKLAIGPGDPASPSSGEKSFDDMTEKEMEKHLRSQLARLPD